MGHPTPKTEPEQVAIRCTDCRRIIAYKLCGGSGRIQVKCPKCGNVINIDLSLRRARSPIFYREAAIPLELPTLN